MRVFAALCLITATRLIQIGPTIISPHVGDTLLGVVYISGTTGTPNFISYDLEYSYISNPSGTWFLISQSDQPVADGILGAWDTMVISDGEYDLRLRVNLIDGSSSYVVVPALKIRNYTPGERPTPSVIETPSPLVFPATILLTTSTPYPANPLVLTPSRILSGLEIGALAAITSFFLLMFHSRIRKK